MASSFPVVLASWQSPPWATITEPLAVAVAHSHQAQVAGLLPDSADAEEADVRLVQVDAVEVADRGRIRVLRRAPFLEVEGLRFSLAGAADLARALSELVAMAGAADERSDLEAGPR